ncbi:hypothetical protein DINM_004977 [Dirofilaria immitis]|nr:hypothetical protein [Dirofilaria immitis]
MGYTWRSTVTIILSIGIGSVYAEFPMPINFTTILIETVKNFQLRGRLFALHVSYIVLGFLSVLFMFGLSIVLLSEHHWFVDILNYWVLDSVIHVILTSTASKLPGKKKDEEDAKTMELVPHNIFKTH